MLISKTLRGMLIGLAGAFTITATAGCGSHDAPAQVPAGTKVGPPLTQAQIHAIQAKRQGNGSPPVQ